MEVKELFSRLKKEAECSICIHTVNKPKSLPCLHSFCLDCINNFAAIKRKQGKTTFGCPVCLAPIEIPDEDKFDDFPTSFYLNRLLDILALEDGNTEQQKCNSCDENAPATSFCFHCKNFLCAVCVVAHNRLKVMRAHRQASLQNLVARDVEELIQRPVMCEKAHHKDEPLEYYCQDCHVCICHKCSVTAHNHHTKLDIGDAAEQHKTEIIQNIHKIKDQVSQSKQEMDKDKANFEAFEEQVKSTRDKVQATFSELFRVLKEHETSIMKQLDDLFTRQREVHSAKQKNFELSLAQMNSSADHMEAIVQRNIGAEILRSRILLAQRCEEIMKEKKANASAICKVDFVRNEELCTVLRQSSPGRLACRGITDALSSTAEGKGLQEAECGEIAEFTIITKDNEGEMCYSENDQVTVNIQTARKGIEAEVKNNKDGTFYVTYTPINYGEHHVTITVNGHVLPGSPWNAHVTPHHYQVVSSFGSAGTGNGEFCSPCGVTVSSTGNVAVADYGNKRVQVFSSEGQYLKEFGEGEDSFQKLTGPLSVAYINAGHIAVRDSSKVLIFTERGEFIKHFSPDHLESPQGISVTKAGHVIVCDDKSKKVAVFTPDGNTLLQSFRAPNCDTEPRYAVYHEDKFFVSYTDSHCVKVFDATGNHTRDIGSEGSGDGQFKNPRGVTIDKFNNLVVVDEYNHRLQIFTTEGEFLSAVGGEGAELGRLSSPEDVAVSVDGWLYVPDWGNARVQILR